MWGRSDLEKYGVGLRRLRNFFVNKQGNAVSRPGSKMIYETKFPGLPVRLVPFIFSDEQTFVLEFGDQYIRFFTDGGVVIDPNQTLAYEFPSEVFDVGDAVSGFDSGATGIIVSIDLDDEILTLSDVTGTFVNGEELVGPDVTATVHGTNAPLTTLLELETPYAYSDLAHLQWAQTGDILTITHQQYPPMELRRLGNTNWELEEVLFFTQLPFFPDVDDPTIYTREPMAVTPLPTADSSHPAQEWRYRITVLYQDAETGLTYESQPYDVDSMYDGSDFATVAPISSTLVIYADKALTLRRPIPTIPLVRPLEWANLTAIGFNYYRGRGEYFGYVGTTKTRDFVDVGDAPNYGVQPPTNDRERGCPFAVVPTEANPGYNDYPAATAFFQERRGFAGTPLRPDSVFLSKTGAYNNFTRYDQPPPFSFVQFGLLTRKRENIRSLLATSRLLAFTSASNWSIAGQQGQGLDRTTIDAKPIEEIGANFLPALLVDGSALYCRTKGQGVRALVPANTLSGYQGQDLCAIAQHLFLGEERTELGSGLLPLEADYTKAIVDWTYAEDPWGVVWLVRDDGVLLSLTYQQQSGMFAWARHDTDGRVKNVCAVPEGDEDAVYMVVERDNGLFVERMASRVRKGSPYDDAAVDCALVYVGTPTVSISGLHHLEGKAVWAVCYGNAPQGPYTVSGGAITLGELPEAFFESSGVPTVVVHVGTSFTAELETLDYANSRDRLKQKTVTYLGLEVDESVGLEAGQDFEHMSEWEQRDVDDGFNAISAATTIIEISVDGTYDKGARGCLSQSQPLPVTVLGITRKVDSGDP